MTGFRMNSFRMRPYIVCCFLVLICGGHELGAEEVYLEPTEFLKEVFGSPLPEPEVLWITKDRKAITSRIMSHGKGARRVRYWMDDSRSAWILEEIGKVKPITTGYVVKGGKIERVAVLIYRESRGWEVRHKFFTDQFVGATVDGDYRLDRRIDGISGATLSVSALTRLGRLALYLAEEIDTETK
ncbi:MAG: FMN-binding protein [Rhodospirillaceae bacterium]|nr:FMN-binding protein [Rhodospirillaceae bacterium]|tara:strand:- start:13 stop:567 length:555 start_codon:yes stop_codon:yes gene_type:complete